MHHNKGPGIWTDIDNINTLIEDNRVEDNARNGIFHEVSYDAVIRNNTCARNGFEMPLPMRGGGIAVTSSPNVQIYGNTLIGNNEGFAINQDERTDLRPTYGPREVVNLHVHDNTVTLAPNSFTGLGVQGGDNSYYMSKNNRFENNTYNLNGNVRPFVWMSGFRTVAEWKAYGQDVNGTFNP